MLVPNSPRRQAKHEKIVLWIIWHIAEFYFFRPPNTDCLWHYFIGESFNKLDFLSYFSSMCSLVLNTAVTAAAAAVIASHTTILRKKEYYIEDRIMQNWSWKGFYRMLHFNYYLPCFRSSSSVCIAGKFKFSLKGAKNLFNSVSKSCLSIGIYLMSTFCKNVITYQLFGNHYPSNQC